MTSSSDRDPSSHRERAIHFCRFYRRFAYVYIAAGLTGLTGGAALRALVAERDIYASLGQTLAVLSIGILYLAIRTNGSSREYCKLIFQQDPAGPEVRQFLNALRRLWVRKANTATVFSLLFAIIMLASLLIWNDGRVFGVGLAGMILCVFFLVMRHYLIFEVDVLEGND